MTTLDEIVARRRKDLERTKARIPASELEERAAALPPALDFAAALKGPGLHLIAEVKKASPSAGLLKRRLNPAALARRYAQSGASAISVLTEPRYFRGNLEHLAAIRASLSAEDAPKSRRPFVLRPPLLRKDFLFDPYQILEARAYGADAVLLIVAILEDDLLAKLLSLTHTMGMEALVEAHNEGEVARALSAGAKVIGINNRDLRTFQVSLATTEKLRPLIPPGHVVVSESGIKGREDVERLRGLGVNAVLIGEALVTAQDVGAKIRELMGHYG